MNPPRRTRRWIWRIFLGGLLGGMAGGRGLHSAEPTPEELLRQVQAQFAQLQDQPQTQTTLAAYEQVLEGARQAAQQEPGTETAAAAQELMVNCYDLLGRYPPRTQATLDWAATLAAVRGPEEAAAQLLALAQAWIDAGDVETRQEPGGPLIRIYRPTNTWARQDLRKLQECQEAHKLFREIVAQYPASTALPAALVAAGRGYYQVSPDLRYAPREAFARHPEKSLPEYHVLLEEYLERQPDPELAAQALSEALALQLEDIRRPPGIVGVLYRVIVDHFPDTPLEEAAEYANIWESRWLVRARAQAFLEHWPTSARAEKVRFRRAQYLLFNKLGGPPVTAQEREDSLQELLTHHPQSAYAPWALFQQGRLAQEQGEPEEAQSRFQEILDRYPASEAVPIASEYLQAMAPEPQ